MNRFPDWTIIPVLIFIIYVYANGVNNANRRLRAMMPNWCADAVSWCSIILTWVVMYANYVGMEWLLPKP